MSLPGQPFLKAVKLSKRYGGVEALRDVDLDIYRGEIIGVVGDTNSGKSTLLRLLSGGIGPDGGHFFVEGRRARLSPSYRAARYGIKVVHQEINFAEKMSALGYIFAGQPVYRFAALRWLNWWDRQEMQRLALDEFDRLNFAAPPLECPLHDLTSAQRKMVAFVHATIRSPDLLLLDEPMNALEAHKATILHLIEDLRARGGSVLLVTQNLEDIFGIADRIVVLNAGSKIAERRTADTTEEEIVRLILGSVEDRLTPAVWALSNYFEVRRQADELDRLNKQLEQRAVQLQAHADVARSATSILDRDKLLVQIVQIIRQRFGYYHVGIFLVDASGEYAVLRSSAGQDQASTGQVDQIRLRVGQQGMIGWCADTGKPRLANDVTQDPLFLPERTLPDVRSELVLPLRVGSRVLGVLDLQSDRRNAFGDDDALALQSLADQLAIAIRNADLFEAAQIARQQADEANRFKSIFMSNMSHELRTPLSAIIGLTQAMLNPKAEFYGVPMPGEYHHDLETICKSGEHLLALINGILDLSRIEAGELKLNLTVIDLASILDDALHTAGGLIHGRPIELRREYPDSLPPLWGDNVRTRQVVLNLLSNAAKFTEHGSITVRAEVGGDEVIVSVADTGIGIPEQARKIIFDRFRQGDITTARKYGGTGLGLNISQQLVELQGGRIWVESAIGRGSVFKFTVPLATPAQIAAHDGEPVRSPLLDARRSVVFQPQELSEQPADTRFVLLAQNESLASFDMRQVLEGAGYMVEPVLVDDLVIEMAEVMLPDLVILDADTGKAGDVLCALLGAPGASAIPVIALVPEASSPPPGLGRSAPAHFLNRQAATPADLLGLAQRCLERPGPAGTGRQ